MPKKKELKRMLSKEFNMKDRGVAKKILGMEIKKPVKLEVLSFSRQVHQQGVEKFNMVDAKPVSNSLA